MRYSPILNNHCTHLHLGGLKGQPAISPGQSDEGVSPWVNKPHGLSPYRGKSKKRLNFDIIMWLLLLQSAPFGAYTAPG